MPNEEICQEIFASNTATGHMAYGSGSAVLPQSDGDIREDTDGAQYEDMSIGENAEDDHVSPSPPSTTSGGLLVNRRSRSIEKRLGKQKSVFKSESLCRCEKKRTKNLNTLDLRRLPLQQTCLTLIKISWRPWSCLTRSTPQHCRFL